MSISDAPRCTARSKRTGQPCTQPVCRGRTKCRLHGGRSRRGLAAPAWKGGRYSKALPPDLVDAYERARTDPELLALRDELALVDARLNALLERLAEGETSTGWARVYEALELRRRLADTERKREQWLQTVLTAEQALAFVGALAASVKRHVQDRAILQAISGDIEAVLRARPELAGGRDMAMAEGMAGNGVA
jgi:hypothetical protein